MLRFGPLLACLLVLGDCPAQASIIVITTSDGPITPGVKNQGWWSRHRGNEDSNDNYVVGRSFGGELFHNFFSFDLRGVDFAGQELISATLELTSFTHVGSTTQRYLLFDVTTPAAILNRNDGINVDIFNDLGSGVSYGAFTVVDNRRSRPIQFPLNDAALDAIVASAGGYFSIGGRLDLTGLSGEQFLFAFSGSSGGSQSLILEFQPLAPPPPASPPGGGATVPEPLGLVLFSLAGCAGVLCARWRGAPMT
jgi:hypothetical protein